MVDLTIWRFIAQRSSACDYCDLRAKDRHVVAAAVAGSAHVIITSNLRDFPASALMPLGIEAQSPDEFLLNLAVTDVGAVKQVIAEQAAALIAPAMTPLDIIHALRRDAPLFAAYITHVTYYSVVLYRWSMPLVRRPALWRRIAVAGNRRRDPAEAEAIQDKYHGLRDLSPKGRPRKREHDRPGDDEATTVDPIGSERVDRLGWVRQPALGWREGVAGNRRRHPADPPADNAEQDGPRFTRPGRQEDR